jgi:Family of unknown function (DUF6459)
MTVTLVRPARGGLAGFGTLMPVRVRPAPAMDPPDDDLTGLGPGEPARGPGEPAPAHAEPVPAGSQQTESLPAIRRGGGEAHRATRRYLDLTLEVLGGFRPIGHLRPLTDPARFEQVVRQLARLGGPPVTRPGSGLARVTGDRVRLRQLRICEVHDGAVEAAAVLARGEEIRAMTLRLERRPEDAWLCTHLAVL